ncbi:MAG: 6-bladed beta-propeller [Balneolaceae bacterium]|nr:6-bladed beta-propeller [Balneolaceae bacterium]MCH8549436.1 6-bladed beta-propeller [Balneolaceae bacterium]
MLLLLVACSEEEWEAIAIPEGIPKYAINPEQTAEVQLDDVLYDYQFLKLETPDDVAIELVRRVIFRDDRIYLFDSSPSGSRAKISVFDSDGTFQFVIDKTGRGPGEYTEIHDVDLTDENIIVISTSQILYYKRSTGSHVRTEENRFGNDRMQWARFFDDDTGVFTAGRGRANRSMNHLKFFDISSDSILYEALPFPSHAVQMAGSQRFLFSTDEGLYTRPVNSNVVYRINNGEDYFAVEPSYALDFGDLWVSEGFLRSSFRNMDQIFTERIYEDFVHTADIFETTEFLYAVYSFGGEEFVYLYDKETGSHKDVSNFGSNRIGWPFKPVATDADRIVGITFPFELSSDESELSPELQQIVHDSDNESNPILIFGRFGLDR